MKKGWHGVREVNRVVFDPEQVSVRQMVQWLKEARTYRRTIEEPSTGENGKEKGQKETLSGER